MKPMFTKLLYILSSEKMNSKAFFTASLAFLLLLVACEQEDIEISGLSNDISIITESPTPESGIITICGPAGNGNYKPLSVHINSLERHLTRGAYIPDADGDGYTAIGACTGSADDCNDNNPFINPGRSETCGNGIDDNCDGLVDAADPDCP